MKDLVSIVVSTRNSARTLKSCLESIRRQTYENVELIVVDNASTDDTVALAQMFTSHVYQWGPERASQRNFGLMQVAQGSISGYIDSDMILGPRVVEESVDAILRGYVGVFVPEVILARGIYGRVRRFERNAYLGTVIDAVRFFRTDAFERIGGFDESLPPGPEDWDLTISLKSVGRLAQFPTLESNVDDLSWTLADLCSNSGVMPRSLACIYHDESSGSFASTVNKKMYYSKGLVGYRAKWGSTNKDVNRQMSPVYRLFGVFFEKRNRASTLLRLHLYFIFLFWKLVLAARLGFRAIHRDVEADSKGWNSP